MQYTTYAKGYHHTGLEQIQLTEQDRQDCKNQYFTTAAGHTVRFYAPSRWPAWCRVILSLPDLLREDLDWCYVQHLISRGWFTRYKHKPEFNQYWFPTVGQKRVDEVDPISAIGNGEPDVVTIEGFGPCSFASATYVYVSILGLPKMSPLMNCSEHLSWTDADVGYTLQSVKSAVGIRSKLQIFWQNSQLIW